MDGFGMIQSIFKPVDMIMIDTMIWKGSEFVNMWRFIWNGAIQIILGALWRSQTVGIHTISKQLKWKSKINFQDGLKDTVIWYLKNKKFLKNISTKKYEKRLGLNIWICWLLKISSYL